MEFASSRNAPGCVDRGADPDVAPLNPEPLQIDGVLYLPASYTCVGTRLAGGDLANVMLLLRIGAAGVYQRLTPAGAREFAGALIRSVEEAERLNTADVAARLDALRPAGSTP